jgi:dihydrolipoamide dehydrogenase
VSASRKRSRRCSRSIPAQGRARGGHLQGQAHHRRDRRAAARAAGHRAGRQADLDLFRGDGAGKMPKSLIVMGSGAIGIEFASFYRTMGAEVTVVELLPQILPVEDAEIAAHARKRFEKQGIKILTGAKVTKVEKKRTASPPISRTRRAAKQAIDGRAADLRRRRGRQYRGARPRGARRQDRPRRHRHRRLRPHQRAGIYAIGDVAGPPMLATRPSTRASSASRRSRACTPHPMDKLKIPGCTYCQPQVASVGLTEAKAKEAGLRVKVGRFPFAATARRSRWASPRAW